MGIPHRPFKIIILDECDSDDEGRARGTAPDDGGLLFDDALLPDLQLRVASSSPWCRVARNWFSPLGSDAMQKRLLDIASAQSVNCDATEIYDQILDRSGGDMRRAVTLLQSCHTFYGDKTPNVEELWGVPASLIEPLLDRRQGEQFDGNGPVDRFLDLEGYSAATCFSELHDIVLKDEAVTDAQKATFFGRRGGRHASPTARTTTSSCRRSARCSATRRRRKYWLHVIGPAVARSPSRRRSGRLRRHPPRPRCGASRRRTRVAAMRHGAGAG